MPYFKNDNVNLLFIHIPKTGGTSVQNYLSYKYKINLNNISSICYGCLDKLPSKIKVRAPLDHLIYLTLIKYKDFFKIDSNNLKILTIVRNPYERIISDLFFHKKIDINSDKDCVYKVMTKYLSDVNNNENHSIPQFLFITDTNHKIINNIDILHTETLTDDMVRLGYVDFDKFNKENVNKFKLNYYDYLNNNSIDLINEYYHNDFKLFNYNKIHL